MSYRLIISFSVVGLMRRSSAAFFCTPPAASSVDSISRFSTSVMTSLNEMPSGGTTNFGMWKEGAERTWSGIRSAPIRVPGAEHDGALHHVLELAHVARPVVLHHHVERVRGQLRCPDLLFSSPYFSRKCCASSGMSSLRSRSGGR